MRARALVNAAGPWAESFLRHRAHHTLNKSLRLIKGSHIVVPRLHEGDHAFILQNSDNRIVFVIPYEHSFSLIGTTDIAVDSGEAPVCSPEEIAYLCDIAGHYMQKPVRPEDVVWTYSGVRPLFDDGDDNPSAVTRDYHLEVDGAVGTAPLLSVFGGKITTYRHLAQEAVEELASRMPELKAPGWTDTAPLPGGDFPIDGAMALEGALQARYPFLEAGWTRRLVRSYGRDSFEILGDAASLADCGQHFGHGLTERELRHLTTHEWARSAADVLWRRGKLGLHYTTAEADVLEHWLAANGGTQ